MDKEEILVLRCKYKLKKEDVEKLRRSVLRQVFEGVVILPDYVETLIVPADIEVRIEEAEA